MLEEADGSLLFISSITGLEAIGAPVDYATAKSALIAFSKNLSKKLAGKSTKKDQKKGKSTLISLIGYEKANSFAVKLKKNILSKLKKYGKKANDLINIVEFILERNF